MILSDISHGDMEGTNTENEGDNRTYEALDNVGVEDHASQTYEPLAAEIEVPTYLEII